MGFILLVFLAVISITITTLFMYKVYESGKRATPFSSGTIHNHRRWVSRFLWATLISICIVELMVRAKLGFDESLFRLFETTLGKVHAGIDFAYVGLLVLMRFAYTGLQNPSVHRALFKGVVGFYFAVIVTGVWLTVLLFK